MSRSGYSDDLDPWNLIRWRGQVASAIRGKRGQAFLRELAETLDSLPDKRLISGELRDAEGNVCAIGSVGVRRGIDMSTLDVHDGKTLAGVFGIARPLVLEIEYMNDEAFYYHDDPEKRWQRVRDWVGQQLEGATQQ